MPGLGEDLPGRRPNGLTQIAGYATGGVLVALLSPRLSRPLAAPYLFLVLHPPVPVAAALVAVASGGPRVQRARGRTLPP